MRISHSITIYSTALERKPTSSLSIPSLMCLEADGTGSLMCKVGRTHRSRELIFADLYLTA